METVPHIQVACSEITRLRQCIISFEYMILYTPPFAPVKRQLREPYLFLMNEGADRRSDLANGANLVGPQRIEQDRPNLVAERPQPPGENHRQQCKHFVGFCKT